MPYNHLKVIDTDENKLRRIGSEACIYMRIYADTPDAISKTSTYTKEAAYITFADPKIILNAAGVTMRSQKHI
jgi:hypothetical protein